MIAIRLIWPFVVRAARRELAPRFDPRTTRAILAVARADYEACRSDIPREASAGGRVMVHLAALTIGLYRALKDHGLTDEEARSLVAGVTGRIYRRMAQVPWLLAARGGGSTRDRVRRATNLFRRVVFSPPAYDMVDLPAGPDLVAFDVRRCPVASYFRSQDLGALCVTSWCNLDFPLAERWGSRLERTGTLAEGAPLCDFRWHVGEARTAPGDGPGGPPSGAEGPGTTDRSPSPGEGPAT